MTTVEALEETSTGMAGWLPAPRDLLKAVRNGVVAALIMALLAIIFSAVLRPMIASVEVEETLTTTIAGGLVLFLPFIAYLATAGVVRNSGTTNMIRLVLTAMLSVIIVYAVIMVGFALFRQGPFGLRTSLGLALSQGEAGILVEAVEPGGPAEAAGIMVGDVITAVRRDPVDLSDLENYVALSQVDDPLRLRFMRDDEEMQETVRVSVSPGADWQAVFTGVILAMIVSVVALYWPGKWTPYLLLLLFLSPLFVGYSWIIIATFSYRTQGIVPLNGEGQLGGFTLENWRFLVEGGITGFAFNIWQLAFNSLLIAVILTFTVVVVAAMAGYALSRMNFPGRRQFLSMTLILHGFPAVTLLIPIFFVLLNIGNLPIIGEVIGYNKAGGIALVMVAFELPLGIWLMKGFFDSVPWDMERSAMIDGASRWRTFWQIALPQIRPGLLALGIFAFVSGWNAYLIPATYSVGTAANVPVLLNQLLGDTAPVNWNQVAAVGMFQLIPIFIFFIFAQEYLLNIYAGGTKGSS